MLIGRGPYQKCIPFGRGATAAARPKFCMQTARTKFFPSPTFRPQFSGQRFIKFPPLRDFSGLNGFSYRKFISLSGVRAKFKKVTGLKLKIQMYLLHCYCGSINFISGSEWRNSGVCVFWGTKWTINARRCVGVRETETRLRK